MRGSDGRTGEPVLVCGPRGQGAGATSAAGDPFYCERGACGAGWRIRQALCRERAALDRSGAAAAGAATTGVLYDPLKYHVVFIPKYRRKTLYGELRRHLGEVFRKLAVQKECRIEEGHLMPDHVHIMMSIPPKYAVSQVVGYIKGKSAIHLARVYGERKRNFTGQHFWARGYFVSTVGRDEAVIREYIRKQEQEDIRLDQLNLWR